MAADSLPIDFETQCRVLPGKVREGARRFHMHHKKIVRDLAAIHLSLPR